MPSWPSLTTDRQDTNALPPDYQTDGNKEHRLQHDERNGAPTAQDKEQGQEQHQDPDPEQSHTAPISVAELQLAAQVSLAHGMPNYQWL
jgi:hypothetical protein